MSETRPPSLDPRERRWLLRLARSTIAAKLEGRPVPDTPPGPGLLSSHRGAFVTLEIDEQLRGCIGHVVGTEALWLSVRSNAVSAAFRDPRFPPVEPAELASLHIEISALTPLRPISTPDEIEIGRDGLVIERGHNRGLLLPQVAGRREWSAIEFLDQTCRKAGMQPGCWRDPDARISAFSAEVFSEAEFG